MELVDIGTVTRCNFGAVGGTPHHHHTAPRLHGGTTTGRLLLPPQPGAGLALSLAGYETAQRRRGRVRWSVAGATSRRGIGGF